jgi:dihydroflavonol-4-reductase
MAQVSARMRLSLVTGGAGFIGGHLVRMLVARGERVRVLDLDAPPQSPAGVEFVQGSICEARTVREAAEGCERVFHLAANPNLWAPDKSVFRQVNLEGTRVVLEEAARSGAKRIVYCSTESILKSWRKPNVAPIDADSIDLTVEDMPGVYTRSKFLAEREAFAAAARGTPVVIVNPTLPMGPGDRLLTPPTRMLLGYLNGETPGYHDLAFNVIDARHAAFGHILAAELGRVGERYILGGVNTRLAELLRMLDEITGRSELRFEVPYWVTRSFSTVSELIANYVTHRPPKAPVEGVRLAFTPMHFDSSKSHRELGLPETNLRHTLIDAVSDLFARGLVRKSLPKLAAAQAEV